MDLLSKTALVTGGAVRIGRAICLALAGRGCNVVVHYNRSEKEAKNLAGMISGMGVKGFTVQGDFSSRKGCEDVVGKSFEQAGHIDFLVNNAAVFHKDNLMSTDEGKFLAEMQVNFFAPIWLTREFAKRCGSKGVGGYGSRKQSETSNDPHTPKPPYAHTFPVGKVINLLDRRIEGIDQECLSYQLSKKMLAEFTKNAALELAPYITVNGVAPGAVLPPRSQRAEVGSQRSEKRQPFDLAGDVPLDRQCTPEDVAAAVVFLLEFDTITGQVIFVDGGQHLIGGVRAET